MNGHNGDKNGEHNGGAPLQEEFDDVLTVLYAAPLVSIDDEGDVTYLDLSFVDREHEHLKQQQEQGGPKVRLRLDHEPCTPHRLRTFLDSKKKILHLACHATEDHVYLEEEHKGDAREVPLAEFQQWLGSCAEKRHLQLVVVADPDPTILVNAFCKAGVAHVVSCPVQKHKLDETALLLCQTFYTALANESTVQDAFAEAKKAIEDSEHLSYTEGRQDLDKYQLLGAANGENHSVVLFPSKTNARKVPSLSLPPIRILPTPPPVFVGRQKDVYQLLCELETARLVTVTGDAGMGAACMVKSACQYMVHRRAEFDDVEIIWLPARVVGNMQDGLLSLSKRVFESIVTLEDPEQTDLEALVDLYRKVRVLLVCDVREWASKEVFYGLMDFLDEVFDVTPNTKAIIVHETTDLGAHSMQFSSSYVEKSIHVKPLGYSSTVNLFGMLCPHLARKTSPSIASVDDLKNLLVPSAGYAGNVNLKMTIINIYNLLGQGSPNRIRDLALSMTAEEYDNLIQVGKLRQKLSRLYQKQIEMAFPTRYSLDVHLTELSEAIEDARNSKNFPDMEMFEAKYDETGRRRKDLPSVDTMLIKRKALTIIHKITKLSNRHEEAEGIAEELAKLKKRITKEREAMMEDDEDFIRSNYVEYPRGISRRTLESRYRAKEHLLFDARKTKDYRLARELEFPVKELRECRSLLPTAEEWNRKLIQLDVQVKEAQKEGDVDQVVKLGDQGDEIQKRLDDENGEVDVARIADDLYLSLSAFLQYTGSELVNGLPVFEDLSSRKAVDECLAQVKEKATSTNQDFDEERENTFVGLYKELCVLIDTQFPSIESLLLQRQGLILEKELVFSDDQEIVEAYEIELEAIEKRVLEERRASGPHEFHGVSKAFYHQGVTRCLIEKRIKELETALEKADDEEQVFDMAELEVKVAELAKHREKLPSAKELDILIDRTEKDLGQLSTRPGNDTKKKLMGRAIMDLKQRREAERRPTERVPLDVAEDLMIEELDYFHAPLSEQSYAELFGKDDISEEGSYSSEETEENELSTVEEESTDGISLDDDEFYDAQK